MSTAPPSLTPSSSRPSATSSTPCAPASSPTSASATPTTSTGHPRPARARGRRPRAPVRGLPAAGLDRRHRRAGPVEDPRQHGDRPQRHARAVRLDEGSAAGWQDVRVGHRLPGRPMAPLAQLHAPHVHEHRRQGPRHRLRDPAHVRGRSPGIRTTSATRCMRRCWRPSSSTGSRCTISKPSGSPPARSPSARSAPMLEDVWRKVRSPDAQGLRAVPASVRPLAPVRAGRQRDRQPDPQPVVVHDHLLRPLPRRNARVHRGSRPPNETRGEWYYRQLLGSANLTGGKLFHVLAGNLSHQIEHHLFPDLPAHRYADISSRCARSASAMASPTTRGPCTGSSAASFARSSSSPCRRCRAAAASGRAAPSPHD